MRLGPSLCALPVLGRTGLIVQHALLRLLQRERTGRSTQAAVLSIRSQRQRIPHPDPLRSARRTRAPPQGEWSLAHGAFDSPDLVVPLLQFTGRRPDPSEHVVEAIDEISIVALGQNQLHL